MSLPANHAMNRARIKRDDEFYTLDDTVACELERWRGMIAGRPVLCNCNDRPGRSAFARFFETRMRDWRIPRLSCVSFEPDYGTLFDRGPARVYTRLPGQPWHALPIPGGGGFDTPPVERLLDEPRVIVVTNPPFSRFNDFLTLLDAHGVDWLVLANLNAATNRMVFPLFMTGRCRLTGGILGGTRFRRPDGRVENVNSVRWYTSLPATADPFETGVRFTGRAWERFDLTDAINVDRTSLIPDDYMGLMGVPVTFLDHYRPGCGYRLIGKLDHGSGPYDLGAPLIGGRARYTRLLIRRDC